MRVVRFHIAVLMLIGLGAHAQQAPQYTQYMFNQFGLNPAVAGSFPCWDFKAGYRTQWVGFDGAPKTFWFSAHGPLKIRSGHNGKHGAGVYLNSDRIGPVRQLYLNFAYAYHVRVQDESWLSLGIFAGLQNYAFRGSEIITPVQDAALDGDNSSLVIPELMPGIWYTSPNSYIGMSLKHSLGNKLKAHGPESDLSRHIYLTGGKRFVSKSGIMYTPSAMIKYAPSGPLAVDLNLFADLSEPIGIGVSYRYQDAVAAMLRLRLSYSFFVGYSFDYTLSDIQNVSSNTHEFVIGWSPCGRGSNGLGGGGGKDKKKNCPAYQ
ncbi:MAG: type IX secretion system membrane protein PorP/SprF [Flavobacteriales bacterium]|nr:type IX secretion system membrane protein PorP/SprF [Flavobacteriales bacterium]MCB9448575.1 type IX secretion system membrane protein PorP/SprF [Flavobacteriales bacterium]